MQNVNHFIPVGETVTDQSLFKIRLAAGADSVRLIPPGAILTRDFKPRRLNIHITEDRKFRPYPHWG